MVAATNRKLESEVKAGRFREDLYYRLSVQLLTTPSLRERREDIRALAQHLIEKYARKAGVGVPELSPEATAVLEAYNWPGNVR